MYIRVRFIFLRIMAVYEISNELKQYLRSCPKRHRKGGAITKWRESDILESKEFEDIISNFSNLLYGDYGYNQIKEYLLVDEKYRKKKIKDINKLLLEQENLSNEQIGILEQKKLPNEQIERLEEWRDVLINFKRPLISVPGDSFPNLTYMIPVKYILEQKLCDYYFSVQNNQLRIVPKKKIQIKIEFQKKRICFDNKGVDLEPKLLALYRYMYDYVKDSGCDTDELINAENELKKYYPNRWSCDFFKTSNPQKGVSDMISEINSKLYKEGILPYYFIKQNFENAKGGKFRIAAFEINREE